MAESFQLEVATPERLIVEERVTEAQVPARGGYLGVLAGHAPLAPGEREAPQRRSRSSSASELSFGVTATVASD